MSARKLPLRSLVLAWLLASGATAGVAQAKDFDAPSREDRAAPVEAQLSSASEEVRRVARWVIGSGDHHGLPFLLVDKVNAQVFAFDASGRLRGEAPVLLGLARGDRLLAANHTAVEALQPQERITPAGRFLSRLAIDSKRQELLVLDYEASISLHPVITTKPHERRVERLGSPTAQDNRISSGCINVPASFYADVVSPTFARTKGVVYVLPETQPASELFGFRGTERNIASAGASGSPSDRAAR